MRIPPTFMSKDNTSILVGLFFIGVLVFNFPLITIYGKGQTLFGLPATLAYFFLAWIALILLVYIWVEKKGKNKR